MMGFADQRMGNLMENRVVDLLGRGVLGKFIRQGDHLRTILTTARPFAAVIELKTPQREVILLQELARLLGNRVDLCCRTRHSGGGASCHLLQDCIRNAILSPPTMLLNGP